MMTRTRWCQKILRRGVAVSQHESENEEEQLWERHSLASGISDVEVAVEVEA